MDGITGAEPMGEGTWIAVALSSVAMVGTALAAWSTRKTARDKLELEATQARDKLEIEAKIARDKLEFDAKLVELKAHHAACQESTAEMKHELEECREEHKLSKADRAALDMRLSAVETRLAPP